MHYTQRYYNDLTPYCLPGKVLVIYGPRQVGKTTLIKHYLSDIPFKYRLDSGDNLALSAYFAKADFKAIEEYAAGYELIVIDEAQEIPNIGQILKIMVDQMPHLRIIVTGSSSFELAGQVGEPLTGRKKTLTLYPISQLELMQQWNKQELTGRVEEYLIYGSYPEIIEANTFAEKQNYITDIAQAYLFKDILKLDKVQNPNTLLDLLRLLAFQLGSEVSHNELAQQLGIDGKTVTRYLTLLEQAFVIINLRGFSRNLRKEMTKKSKYYFYDNGIRNALIANFNGISLRNDVGALWENFLFIERIKKCAYQNLLSNRYFWRTWDQKEIDYIEDRGGELFAYEFKWGNQKAKEPKDWKTAYPRSTFELINIDNYLTFIV